MTDKDLFFRFYCVRPTEKLYRNYTITGRKPALVLLSASLRLCSVSRRMAQCSLVKGLCNKGLCLPAVCKYLAVELQGRLEETGKVKDYIVTLVYATRDPERFNLKLKHYIENGASPRATINLTLAAKASAFLAGRGFVTPQDVKTLAMDVLRHRVAVTYEAEAENVTSEDLVKTILDNIPVP